MKEEKLRFSAYLLVAILSGLALGYIGLKYLLPLLLPFLLAWGIALCVRPLAARLSGKIHLPEKPLRVVLSLLVLLVGLGGVSLLLSVLVSEAWSLVASFSERADLSEIIARLFHPFEGIFGGRAEELLSGALSGALSALGSLLSALAGGIPRAALFLVVTCVATVYFSTGLERFHARIRAWLPASAAAALSRYREHSLKTALRYLLAYGFLALVTFSILLVGFLVLRAPYALLLAVLVALLDALPVIGVGTVLVPWSLFELLSENTFFGVGLLVLFAVNETVRQAIEPKVVGKNLGIPPLLTLLLLYLSYSVFGLAGLLLTPLLALLLEPVFSDGGK